MEILQLTYYIILCDIEAKLTSKYDEHQASEIRRDHGRDFKYRRSIFCITSVVGNWTA